MSDQKQQIPELDDLINKFTELLTGESNPDRVEMIKTWCIYSHMMKVMPPLIQHWGSEPSHQEAKAQIKQIFDQIKQWNQEKNNRS
ncbi:DUF2573 family protein [Brevibacillus sp. SYSU BS000544]|uniref:DUF2573 family protein n=1 Tax=Brevibacillus sp. SYSU BS000544 TaxID=3416443 RepID=UPI003CE44C56